MTKIEYLERLRDVLDISLENAKDLQTALRKITEHNEKYIEILEQELEMCIAAKVQWYEVQARDKRIERVQKFLDEMERNKQ